MVEICPKCGLPKDLCICGEVAKEAAKIKIYIEKRRFGKSVTIVEGVEESLQKSVASKLKSKLACGGTFKDNKIELQGEHKEKAKKVLIDIGFNSDQIEME